MQKINLRELYPDVYKTDVFVDVAEEVVAASARWVPFRRSRTMPPMNAGSSGTRLTTL